VIRSVKSADHPRHERDQDAGDRAAGDVARREQHAGALVAFGGQLLLGQRSSACFFRT
jgi:hypothetical protein